MRPSVQDLDNTTSAEARDAIVLSIINTGNGQALKYLLQHYDQEISNQYKGEMLLQASRKGFLDIIKQLIETERHNIPQDYIDKAIIEAAAELSGTILQYFFDHKILPNDTKTETEALMAAL